MLQGVAKAYLNFYFLCLPFVVFFYNYGAVLYATFFILACLSLLVFKNFCLPVRFPGDLFALFFIAFSFVALSSDLIYFEINASLVVLPTLLSIVFFSRSVFQKRAIYLPAATFVVSLLATRSTGALKLGADLSDVFAHSFSFSLLIPLLHLLLLKRFTAFFLITVLSYPLLQRDAQLALLLVSFLYILPTKEKITLAVGKLIICLLILYPVLIYALGKDFAEELSHLSSMRTVFNYQLLDFKFSSLFTALEFSGTNKVSEILAPLTQFGHGFDELKYWLIKEEGYQQCSHNLTLTLIVNYGVFSILVLLPLFFVKNLREILILVAFITIQSFQCGTDNFVFLSTFYFAFCFCGRKTSKEEYVK